MKFSELSKQEMAELVAGKNLSTGNSKGGGRKLEVLNILKTGIFSVSEVGRMLSITNRNVSSIICYLRDDGYDIRKIAKGQDVGLVLWSKIVGGTKVGNRMTLGKGKVIRFNFETGKFE